MRRPANHVRARGLSRVGLLAAAAAAGAAVALATGMAFGSSFTLSAHKNVHVTNDPTKMFRVKPVNTHEAVAVGPSGYAVYTFQGETTHHLICKSKGGTGCLGFWPPVQVKSAKGISKAPGIKGKLGTFNRSGVGLQVTLNGQPLYYFLPDIQSHNKGQAVGDELKTFGSIWHIVTAGSAQGTRSSQPTMPPTTTTTTPYVWG